MALRRSLRSAGALSIASTVGKIISPVPLKFSLSSRSITNKRTVSTPVCVGGGLWGVEGGRLVWCDVGGGRGRGGECMVGERGVVVNEIHTKYELVKYLF